MHEHACQWHLSMCLLRCWHRGRSLARLLHCIRSLHNTTAACPLLLVNFQVRGYVCLSRMHVCLLCSLIPPSSCTIAGTDALHISHAHLPPIVSHRHAAILSSTHIHGEPMLHPPHPHPHPIPHPHLHPIHTHMMYTRMHPYGTATQCARASCCMLMLMLRIDAAAAAVCCLCSVVLFSVVSLLMSLCCSCGVVLVGLVSWISCS